MTEIGELEILENPLTVDEAISRLEDGRLVVNVYFDFEDMFLDGYGGMTLDMFLDALEGRVLEEGALEDIGYEIIKVAEDDALVIRVNAALVVIGQEDE